MSLGNLCQYLITLIVKFFPYVYKEDKEIFYLFNYNISLSCDSHMMSKQGTGCLFQFNKAMHLSPCFSSQKFPH